MSTDVPSAHIDRYALEHLPPREQWPEFLFELPELRFPARLNCATELLDRAVDEHGWGERPALIAGREQASYRALRELANRIARVLVEDMGLVPGNRVLLRGGNGILLAAAWFAVQKAGAIAVTTMPLLRAKELGEIVAKAQVSHALCEHALLGELETARQRCPTLAQVLPFATGGADGLEARLAGKPAEIANVDTAAADIALIAFTSGTTGVPKGAMHSHRDVMAVCACFPRSMLSAGSGDRFCGPPPFAFTYGLGGLLLFPLALGAASVLIDKPTPEALARAIEEHRPTVLFATPTFYRGLLGLAERHDFSSLRQCVSAGEALPAATRAAWRTATGIELVDGIGSTEMLHIFISARAADARPGATGKPIPGYRAAVLDADGNEAPAGVVGRLAVKGPTGCRYLADARQTSYVQDGWNITGDAYLVDADGYFHYQARTDDLIISAGCNIGGPEVEEALLAHPAVAECGVIGVPDAERGQAVKAFVVPRPGWTADAALAQQLQEHVKAVIAPYKSPRQIEFRAGLPRTETGKLQRFRLRQEADGSRHDIVQPEGWARPLGFAHGMRARGQMVFTGGQVGWDAQGRFHSLDLVDQVRQTLKNVAAVVAAAGGTPGDIVRLTWYLTDRREYHARLKDIGVAYREIMGGHYPAMAIVQVAALMEDAAKVEIEATAVIPDPEEH